MSRQKTKQQAVKTMPARTLAAIMEAEATIVKGVSVRNFTLGLAAVLEEIESPLLNGRPPTSHAEIVINIFVMTRPAAESQKLLAKGFDAFRAAAFAWADKLDISDAQVILTQALGKILRAVGVIGAGAGEQEKNAVPAATAG
jgi:hypothetical protein